MQLKMHLKLKHISKTKVNYNVEIMHNLAQI
jgi:hypothetical protein